LPPIVKKPQQTINIMDYKTVFEITNKGFDLILLLPVLFILIGLSISLFNIKYNKSKSPTKKFTIIFGFIFSGFALLMSLAIIPNKLSTWYKTNKIFENKEYQVVEGVIENFHPMPEGGHDIESFTVNGVKFAYSDYELIYGFNNAASHGGPLKENGQQVRLSYITIKGENRILKIELKQ
jgi:hypothetical protein